MYSYWLHIFLLQKVSVGIYISIIEFGNFLDFYEYFSHFLWDKYFFEASICVKDENNHVLD